MTMPTRAPRLKRLPEACQWASKRYLQTGPMLMLGRTACLQQIVQGQDVTPMSGQIPTALGPQVGLIISGSDIGTIGGYTARATCPIGPAIQATASIAVADFPAGVAVDDGLASPPAG